MPISTTLTEDGSLLIADGFGEVLVYRGFDGAAGTAGVRPPATAVTLTGSGDAYTPNAPDPLPPDGARAGLHELCVYLARQAALAAFLAADSYLLVLQEAAKTTFSPLDEAGLKALNFAVGAALAALGLPANFVPPQTTTAPSTPALPEGSANAINGKYRAWVRFVDRYGNYSDPSPLSEEAVLFNAASVTYSNVPVPAEPKVVRRQILRNTDGQYRTFYVDVDTTDLAGASFTSSRSDANLQNQEAQAWVDGEGVDRAHRFGVPPDDKSVLCTHRGRVFAAGEVVYREGAAAVTYGSAAVTGVGTEWTAACAKRWLYVDGADDAYRVTAVDPTAQTLTLDAPYRGATDPFARYALRPAPAQRRLVAFSEAGLPEAWPAVNALAMPDDSDEITALLNQDSFLYIFMRGRHYRFTFGEDPLKDGGTYPAGQRGCVNHRCLVVVDGVVYALDEGGVHTLGRRGSEDTLSTPIAGIFRGDSDNFRVNWEARRFFHCCHFPQEEAVRWFVALSGTYLPRHALCLHVPTGRWWVEEYPRPVGASALGRLYRDPGSWAVSRPQAYLGLAGRKVVGYPVGATDGPDPEALTLRGTPTAAGVASLTDAGATWGAALVGAPVDVVAGRGKGQRRVVTAVSGTTLTVDQPWLVRPDATSTYQLGGVRVLWRSAVYDWAAGEGERQRLVSLLWVPQGKAATLDLKLYPDQSNLPEVWRGRRAASEARGVTVEPGDDALAVDLTKEDGYAQQVLDGHRDHRLDGEERFSVELSGVGHAARTRVRDIVLHGAEG